VMTFVPERSGTLTRKCPSAPAVALTTTVASPDAAGWAAAITTVLPARAVPVTTIRLPATAAVTETGSTPGGPDPDRTYRSATTAGWSPSRPLPRSVTSRRYWA